PLNPALVEQVQVAVARLRGGDGDHSRRVPVELVTASASGLDPDISPAAARFQVPRIARVRGLEPSRVESLIASHQRAPLLGFIGEARVNVLELNLALDAMH